MMSFRASKDFKDKVTRTTSALCANMGGWVNLGGGDDTAALSAYYRNDGYGSQIRLRDKNPGFQGCSCKKESKTISLIWIHCLLHADDERVGAFMLFNQQVMLLISALCHHNSSIQYIYSRTDVLYSSISIEWNFILILHYNSGANIILFERRVEKIILLLQIRKLFKPTNVNFRKGFSELVKC